MEKTASNSKSSLHKVVDKVEASGFIQSAIDYVKDDFEGMAAKIEDAAGDVSKLANKKAASAVRSARAEIRRKPIQSVAIAAGVGVFFTLLYRR